LVGNARSVTNLGTWNSHHIDKIDCQRISWPKSTADTTAAVEEFRTVIDTASGGQPGSLVYEPLQAKAGVHLAPQGYLSQAVGLFQQKKGVAICD
jgi:4-aminobutyrate aminotransferase-like enzyme